MAHIELQEGVRTAPVPISDAIGLVISSVSLLVSVLHPEKRTVNTTGVGDIVFNHIN